MATNNTRLSAVLFDLDYTLHDRDAALRSFLPDQFARFDLGERLGITVDDFIRQFTDADQHGYGEKKALYAGILRGRGDEVTPEVLSRDFTESKGRHAKIYPGVHDTLRKLIQRYQLGIITNGKTQGQRGAIEALDLMHWMEIILVSEEAGVKKPDPRIFHQAAEALGLAPPQCVFVGDHPDYDVAGATRAGMTAVWIRRPWYTPPETGFTIERIGDLPALLDSLATTDNLHKTV